MVGWMDGLGLSGWMVGGWMDGLGLSGWMDGWVGSEWVGGWMDGMSGWVANSAISHAPLLQHIIE